MSFSDSSATFLLNEVKAGDPPQWVGGEPHSRLGSGIGFGGDYSDGEGNQRWG